MSIAAMIFVASTLSGPTTQGATVFQPSIAFRDSGAGRYAVPSKDVAREVASGDRLEELEASAVRLSEERLASRAGGVRVRLHGAFRSALVRADEIEPECAAVEQDDQSSEMLP
jgi:hypothetical protein